MTRSAEQGGWGSECAHRIGLVLKLDGVKRTRSRNKCAECFLCSLLEKQFWFKKRSRDRERVYRIYVGGVTRGPYPIGNEEGCTVLGLEAKNKISTGSRVENEDEQLADRRSESNNNKE